MARVGDRGGAYRVLVGRTDEKRPLGRRWMENIKNGSSRSGMGSVDWIDLA